MRNCKVLLQGLAMGLKSTAPNLFSVLQAGDRCMRYTATRTMHSYHLRSLLCCNAVLHKCEGTTEISTSHCQFHIYTLFKYTATNPRLCYKVNVTVPALRFQLL